MSRNKRVAAALLALSVLVAPAAGATNLRGIVITAPSAYGWTRTGRAGVPVALTAVGQPTRQTITTGSGYYFFTDVPAGQYILQVGGQRYGVTVTAAATQDIPPVLVK